MSKVLIVKVCEIKKSGQKYITIPKKHHLYNAEYVRVEQVRGDEQ